MAYVDKRALAAALEPMLDEYIRDLRSGPAVRPCAHCGSPVRWEWIAPPQRRGDGGSVWTAVCSNNECHGHDHAGMS